MGMMFYDYEFKSEEYRNTWRCILNNTYENMELNYRKQFSMQGLLSYFKKAFGITPITIKNSTDDSQYQYKILAVYLLTKYSKETFEYIANEFHISVDTVTSIDANSSNREIFQDEIKLFFKQFEEDYIYGEKSSLAFRESLELLL